MAKKSTDHVVIRMTPPNYTMDCRHCGDSHVLHTPVSMDMALAQMQAFGKQHRNCPKPQAAEAQA